MITTLPKLCSLEFDELIAPVRLILAPTVKSPRVATVKATTLLPTVISLEINKSLQFLLVAPKSYVLVASGTMLLVISAFSVILSVLASPKV